MKNRKSFTLIELILVVTVMVILAAIAIPNFAKSKRRAVYKEGYANIKLIAAAERTYRVEQGGYVNCECSTAAKCAGATGCNALLKLMLKTANWTYSVADDNTNKKITATAAASKCVYTLSSDNFDVEPTATNCS
jgi:type II secretory pathway pseudopilin PulG